MTADNGDGVSGTNVNRRTVLGAAGKATVGAAALGATTGSAAADGSYTRHEHGGLEYTKYVPGAVDGSDAVPLVVMLHGCTQDADDFAAGTGMNEVADENEFVVLYPEQSSGRHYNDCWQWFNDRNTTWGRGEAAIIAGMVDEVKSEHNIDDGEVYAAGLSAGGAMVPNLVVEYADVFSAAGVHSGLEYDAVEDENSGLLAMTQCTAKDPQEAGTRAYDRMEEFGITDAVPTIVFHGTDDTTVYPCNGEQAAEQATQTNDLAYNDADDDAIDYDPDETYTDCSAPKCAAVSEFHDPDGRSLVEYWEVDGLGHAWAGGDSAGSYTDPDGPDASREMWAFFSNGATDPGDDDPVAEASADPNPAAPGESITFDASNSSHPDGAIESYEWDFDDGTAATGETVTHSYDSTGTRTVELRITGTDGATATDTVTLDVIEDGFDGYCGTDDNYSHVDAGRAWTDGSYAYAEGSDENMGLYNVFETSRLKETSPGYFELVESCDG
ncbi:PHB depolymerase family esterase [Halosolutus amylolyticus]|uniref:PHB depolymerase family esterase n=1 Tax=Halosolutus amylolyticus TaxID=2932267 RepID=A0ABD5PRP0_9EURY|nr:PHB depolymerase family esterase [Halosolutus amylolyticus]